MCLRRAVRVSLLVAIASLPFVVFGAAAATATASPAPITIAYITDLTGEGAAENSASAGWVRGTDRHAERSRAA